MTEENRTPDPQASKKRQTGKKVSLGKKIAIAVVYFILICGILGVAGGGFLAYQMIQDAPQMEQSDFEGLNSTQILDKDGELITELGAYFRENISYDEMPNSLIDAFVAIEDSRFFEHPGFDIPRFVRAALENL